MLFRIGGDRHFDVRDSFDAGDEVGGVAIAARMRRIAFADTAVIVWLSFIPEHPFPVAPEIGMMLFAAIVPYFFFKWMKWL